MGRGPTRPPASRPKTKSPKRKTERSKTPAVKPIRESSKFVTLEHVNFDKENGIIRDVAVLGNVSRNGYTYAESAMAKAVEAFEGAKVYLDHREDADDGKTIRPHSVMDFVGRVTGLYLDGDKVKAKSFRIINSQHRMFLEDVITKDPTAMGLSIDGLVQVGDDGKTVVDFVEGYSVDLVSDPATNRGVFESKRHKESTVDLSQLTLDDLKSQRPDLVDEILSVGMEEVKTALKELMTKIGGDGGEEAPPEQEGETPPAPKEGEQTPPPPASETPPATPPAQESLLRKCSKRKLALNEAELEIAESLKSDKQDKYLDSLVASRKESGSQRPPAKPRSGATEDVKVESLFS